MGQAGPDLDAQGAVVPGQEMSCSHVGQVPVLSLTIWVVLNRSFPSPWASVSSSVNGSGPESQK